MATDNQTTIAGNLVDTPELRFTNTGTPVTNLRVAVTQRIQENGEWRDGETSFFKVNVWRGQAEHLADSLAKGDRVMVTGRLRQRSWETPEGEKRSAAEIEADEVGASLKFSTAKVERATERTTGERSSGRERQAERGDDFNDPAILSTRANDAPGDPPPGASLVSVGSGPRPAARWPGGGSLGWPARPAAGDGVRQRHPQGPGKAWPEVSQAWARGLKRGRPARRGRGGVDHDHPGARAWPSGPLRFAVTITARRRPGTQAISGAWNTLRETVAEHRDLQLGHPRSPARALLRPVAVCWINGGR
jgi:single-strand DNA-binding protein